MKGISSLFPRKAKCNIVICPKSVLNWIPPKYIYVYLIYWYIKVKKKIKNKTRTYRSFSVAYKDWHTVEFKEMAHGTLYDAYKKNTCISFSSFYNFNFILPIRRFCPSWISLSRFICFLACLSKLFKTWLSLLRELPPCFRFRHFQYNLHRPQPTREPLLQHRSAHCHLLTWASWIQTCLASYWNSIYW